MTLRMRALAAAGAVALSGCRYAPLPRDTIPISRCDWRTGSGCAPVPAACAADGSLPDPWCTPGALNPDVTPATVDATICSPGWTRSVRPPERYTAPLKTALMRAYGAGDDPGRFELDHLVPLELGGAPADPLNLWPEAHVGDAGSYEKDSFENFLREQVCARTLSLRDAQERIATDWASSWRAAGSPRDDYSGP